MTSALHSALHIGILALQGDFSAHQNALEALGARVRLIRAPEDLDGLDGLLLPGGESTVMSRLCERYGLFEPLRACIDAGMPTFGTCAGLIFLARQLSGASQNFAQRSLESLDLIVARNAYGSQIDSFEAEISVPSLQITVRGVFIRAPRIESVGKEVEILATHENAPVLVRQGAILALSFHPEIAGERRLHQMWLDSIPQHRDPISIEFDSVAPASVAPGAPR